MKSLLLIVFLLAQLPAFAQKQGQARIDSMVEELPKIKDDKFRSIILFQISHAYLSIDVDKSYYYDTLSMAITKKLHWLYGESSTYWGMGRIYVTKGDSTAALSAFSEALKLSEQVSNPKERDSIAALTYCDMGWAYCVSNNMDKGNYYYTLSLALSEKMHWELLEANNYRNLRGNYMLKGNYAAALDVDFKALKLFESTDNKLWITYECVNLSEIYRITKDYPKSLEYASRALKIAREIDDKYKIVYAVQAIGATYIAQGNYDTAIEYETRTLHLLEELNDTAGAYATIGNIAVIYNATKRYPLALVYDFRALRLVQKMNSRENTAVYLGNIGEVYLSIAKDTAYTRPDSLVPGGRAANLAKAVEYLQKGVAAAKETQYGEAILEFSQYLSEAYTLQGNYKAALDVYKQAVAMKDSTFNITNSQKITNLETQRMLELKDKDIQIAQLDVARKRNERYGFMAGITLLLVIMGILFRNFKNQQKSNVLLTKEKQRSDKLLQRSDELLLNILPAEVADELKDSGSATAKQFDRVSVLFTDFVNFTNAAEQMSPTQLVQELHECFTTFDAIIERNGLEKIKTIGDAYMAVCGLPAADPQHARKTVQAALEIRDFMKERQRRQSTFQIRVGVNSGPVVAGIVGVKKFAYDIWGDTVNIAARLEQNSLPDKVNISEATCELVKNDFTLEQRGKITVKNKGEIEMYFVEKK